MRISIDTENMDVEQFNVLFSSKLVNLDQAYSFMFDKARFFEKENRRLKILVAAQQKKEGINNYDEDVIINEEVKPYNKVKETKEQIIIKLLSPVGVSLTTYELCDALGVQYENSNRVGAITSKLFREGKIEKSADRPIRFYLKGRTDPQIADMLVSGTKGSRMT